ncbi:unnamed protein product, partial [marine sediment metagenome]
MKVHAGRFKGTPIKVKTLIPIRPTTDKIREWIFQIIEPHLPESRFLDLYAGSGIVGIEALSCGSKFVVFVDNTTSVLIRQNLHALGHTIPAKIYKEDVLHFLCRKHPATFRFHIINADPPYNYDHYPQLLRTIANTRLLEEGGLFILESGKHSTIASSDLMLPVLREKGFGETRVTIFKKGT